jgi:hypothetical protein
VAAAFSVRANRRIICRSRSLRGRVFQSVPPAKQRRNVSATQNSLCHPRKMRKITSCRNSSVTTPLLWMLCRDQRALRFAARVDGRPFLPLDHARFASQTARSSRACMVQGRRRGGLPSAVRRRRCAPATIRQTHLSALRSTFHAHRPQTEAKVRTQSGVKIGLLLSQKLGSVCDSNE